MTNEVLNALVRANLAGGAAALVLLVLRNRLRPTIGPSAVYALWLTVPAAGLASLLPARTVAVVLQAVPEALGMKPNAAAEAATGWDVATALVALWLVGAAAGFLAIGWRHIHFLFQVGLTGRRARVVRAVKETAGPAVVGLIRPRILLPADFSVRFTRTQRRIVLAHEAVHLSRGDSRINAGALLLQCLCWFNPLAHVAARAMRLDQELSCDALVMARFPKARRSYAEALLKSQVGDVALPIGCYWPARGPSVLSHRLSMLRAAPLSRTRLLGGLALAGLMAAAAGAAGWSAQPPRQRIVWREAAQPLVVMAQPRRMPPAKAQPRLVSHGHQHLAPLAVEAVVQAQPRPQIVADGRPLASSSPVADWFSMPMMPDSDDGEADEVAVADAGQSGQRPEPDETVFSGQRQIVNTYRNGAYLMKSDFVPVGGRVQVYAQLSKDGAVIATGVAVTTPGHSALVSLSNGQMAEITPGKMANVITRRVPVLNQWRGPS